MKKLIATLMVLLTLGVGNLVRGQMVTNDPIHTGITALIKMFQDPSFKSLVGNIEKLSKVASAVRQFHRGTEIISSVSRITSSLSSFSLAVSKDGHIYPAEYKLMSEDIKAFGTEAAKMIKDMKASTTQSGAVLKMTDAERVKWLNETYEKIYAFESMINKYFARIQNVSLRRAGSKQDLVATSKLYTAALAPSTGFFAGAQNVNILKNGYDAGYNDSDTIALDLLYKTEAYKTFQKKMRECEFRNQMFYKRQELAAKNMELIALQRLLNEGGFKMIPKKTFMQSQANANFNLQNYINATASDTSYVSAYGQTSGGGTVDISSFIEDEILSITDNTGKRISPEIFQMYIEQKSKEIYLEYKMDEKLADELKINECRELHNEFDKVMKAATDEYKRINNIP